MPDDRVIACCATLLERTTGLRSPESNRTHLRRIVARESRRSGNSPEQLLSQYRADPRALQRLVDEAMIGETYFFRESAHFRYLRDVVMPELRRRQGSVTAWSASCSSGEEAISLAVVIDAARGAIPAEKVCVYASDIRSDMPDRIRRGEYPLSALRRDGSEFHDLFRRHYVQREHNAKLIVSSRVIDSLVPQTINLFRDSLAPIPDELDFVFFRNTLIYAPEENRRQIIDRIVPKIRPGGYLFLANSELPFIAHRDLELVEGAGTYCLRRRSDTAYHATTTDADATPGAAATAEATTAATPGAAVPAASIAAADARQPVAGDAGGDPAATGPDSNCGTDRPGPSSYSISDVLVLIEGLPAELEPNGPVVETEAERLARAVLNLFSDLDAGRFDRAARHLDEASVIQPDGEVLRYSAAWYAYCTGDTDSALQDFATVLADNDDLWPAHFYCGKIRRHTDPIAAKDDLTACIEAIDRSPGEDLRFLVGGFDPRQIRSLCVRWIEGIDTSEVGRNYGS